MINFLKSFLNKHRKSQKPLLLALSGGPDSLALFHMLLEIRDKELLDFAIAHIDHGWRPESGTEAEILRELALKHHIPFHCIQLEPKSLQGNLEAACRLERLRFFKELLQKHDYEAVLMGHHADDAAETVLKRLFESSSLNALAGLQEISFYEGLPIWRPLLKSTKNEILEWLSKRSLSAFQDATNQDLRYLRARMRQEILPYLNSYFGKSVSPSLLHLSQEAASLHDYTQERIKPYTDTIVEGKWGLSLDLTQASDPHPYELKEIIRHFANRAHFPLSREALNNAVELLMTNSANKQITTAEKTLFIDRKRLFFPYGFPDLVPEIPLKEGVTRYGPWKVTAQPDAKAKVRQGWASVWEGHCSVNLPHGDYSLAPISPGSAYRDKSRIDAVWNDKKVPAFLRTMVPGIWKDNVLIHEFLTDLAHVHSASKTLLITLELTP